MRMEPSTTVNISNKNSRSSINIDTDNISKTNSNSVILDCEPNEFQSHKNDSDDEGDKNCCNNKVTNCDNRKILLKKNLSWTTPHTDSSHQPCGNVIAVDNCIDRMKHNLKTSCSNPQVLETAANTLTTHVKNLTNSRLKSNQNHINTNTTATPQHQLEQESNQNQNQSLQLQSQSRKLAPLAKAISTTSNLTVATTALHTAATTPTAITIQFKQRNSFFHILRAIFSHCKVIKIKKQKICLILQNFI